MNDATEAKQAEMKSMVRKEQQLIKDTFSTPQGKKLLALLADQYVWDKQLHSDPYVLYSRIGVQDLITHFMKVTGDKP